MSLLPLRIPPAVRPGATLGLIAPASLPENLGDIETAAAALEASGYRLKQARPVRTRRGYLADTDEARAEELHLMLADPEVDALLAARGGYGCLRILPLVDLDIVRAHPKLIIGYSDLTALHLSLLARTGLVGLSGPILVDWTDPQADTIDRFEALVRGADAVDLSTVGDDRLQPLVAGEAEGPLIGGNLAVLSRLIGTPHLPRLEGAILFVEDVGEAPYRVDAMLAHLKLAGALDAVGGVVLGRFTDWSYDRPTLDMEAVFNDYFSQAPYPVAYGLPYGHQPKRLSMPVGIQARLQVDAESASLTTMEPLTRRASS